KNISLRHFSLSSSNNVWLRRPCLVFKWHKLQRLKNEGGTAAAGVPNKRRCCACWGGGALGCGKATQSVAGFVVAFQIANQDQKSKIANRQIAQPLKIVAKQKEFGSYWYKPRLWF